MMKKPAGLYQNTLLLSALSVLERGLGFVYRIALARLLGAEGLGVYQVAVSYFFMLRTLGGGGLPVTLSRTVAKNNAENGDRKNGGVLSSALLLSLFVTLPLTLFFLLFSDKIPALARGGAPLKLLVLSLSPACAYAVIKGFFFGNKQFAAPALLEFFEEIVMTVLGAGLLLLTGPFTPVGGATRAALAMSISCFLSFLFSLFTLLKQKFRFCPPRDLKPLLFSAAPITAVRSGSTLVGAVVSTLLPLCLVKTGMTEGEALAAYGVATGMVLPLLTMPMTIVGSLATVLVPDLSEAYHRKDAAKLSRGVEKGLLFTVLLACGLIPLFNAVGEELGRLAYGNELAGEMLSRSGALLLPMSLCAITQSMLNSMGFEKQSFVFSCFGSALFLLAVFFLPNVCGIYAYIVGLALEFLLGAICALAFLLKRSSVSKAFYKKSIAAVLLVLPPSLFGKASLGVFLRFFGEPYALFFAALSVLAVTLLLFFLFGLFQKSDRA